MDWLLVGRSALWILGASLVVATLSYAAWWAAEHGISTRETLIQRPFAAACAAGLTMLCIGVAAGATRTWERGIWLALAAALAWACAAAARRETSEGDDRG